MVYFRVDGDQIWYNKNLGYIEIGRNLLIGIIYILIGFVWNRNLFNQNHAQK